MSFPKKGKSFPSKGVKVNRLTNSNFALEIATALKKALGTSNAGVKTAAMWTGANERTVKNWFAGRYGPSGIHLVALATNSDEVLCCLLSMVGRLDLIAARKIATAQDLISEMIRFLNSYSDFSAAP